MAKGSPTCRTRRSLGGVETRGRWLSGRMSGWLQSVRWRGNGALSGGRWRTESRVDDADLNKRRLTRGEAVALLSRPLVGVFSTLSVRGWIHSVPVHFL